MAVLRYAVLGITILAFGWATRCPLAGSGAPCEKLLAVVEAESPLPAPPPVQSRADEGLRHPGSPTVVAATAAAAPQRCVPEASPVVSCSPVADPAPVARPPFSLPPSRAPPGPLVG